ncbi:MAG: UDP-N-acetylmuramate dehydrogenase, partial [Legionellales bacterium]
ASECVMLRSLDELIGIHKYIKAQSCSYFILGGGSNVLLPDRFDGLVLLSQTKGIDILSEPSQDTIRLRVMAGEQWDNFVALSLDNGWFGLENLSLIPGTVGAAPIQNIGAYGVEVKDFIECVECFDLNTGQFLTLYKEECAFSYRSSRFKTEPHLLVIAVVFCLSKVQNLNLSYGDIAGKMALISNPKASDLRHCIIETRQSKLPDPQIVPNVGSFFHNPVLIHRVVEQLQRQYPKLPVYFVDENCSKVSAGWLIDNLGLKGYQYKNVGIYEKQALVFVNYGASSRSELLELAHIIQDKVFTQYRIELPIEPILI